MATDVFEDDADTLDNLGKDGGKDDAKVGGIAADRLRSLIERIERLEEERKALSSDIKDIYAESKSAGFRSPVSDILCMYAQRVRGGIYTNSGYYPLG